MQKDAVSNFVNSIDLSLPREVHILNVFRDAQIYKWSERMINEIIKQIYSRYKEINVHERR